MATTSGERLSCFSCNVSFQLPPSLSSPGSLVPCPRCGAANRVPLIGGYNLNEPVYYAAESHAFDNGDRVAYRMLGKVVGEAPSPIPGEAPRLEVKFPGNRFPIICELDAVSRTEPEPEAEVARREAEQLAGKLATYGQAQANSLLSRLNPKAAPRPELIRVTELSDHRGALP